VPINQALSATFSVAMNPATIDAATFTLSGPGGIAVDGRSHLCSGWIGGDVHARSLEPACPARSIRPRSPPEPRIWRTALASNYVWTFTTAAAVVIMPPTVIRRSLQMSHGGAAEPDRQRDVQRADEPGHDQLDNL
jgi:hypothetical protein